MVMSFPKENMDYFDNGVKDLLKLASQIIEEDEGAVAVKAVVDIQARVRDNSAGDHYQP